MKQNAREMTAVRAREKMTAETKDLEENWSEVSYTVPDCLLQHMQSLNAHLAVEW